MVLRFRTLRGDDRRRILQKKQTAMIYLKSFRFPTAEEEELCGGTKYPFRILSAMDLNEVTFDHVTIFHGGNGAGKSTIIKVIAAKLGINPETLVNSYSMQAYTQLCSESSFNGFDHYDEEKRDFDTIYDVRRIVRLLSSDDVFNQIITRRKDNQRYDMRKNRLEGEWTDAKNYRIRSINFETGEGVAEYRHAREVSRKRKSQFVDEILGERSAEYSNGESSLQFFTQQMAPGHLYLLDEPENSFSASMQLELAKLITEYARYCDCQFIIATHSPFILAIQDAKIYDLDCYPVEIKKWYELESVQTYQRFFQIHQSKFTE